jgi:hypothetical protein
MNFIADWREDAGPEEAEWRGMAIPGVGSGRAAAATRLEVGVLKSRYGQVGQWDALAFEGRFHRLRDPYDRMEV